MPNPQIDKVNVNGTTYDIVDTTSGYITSYTETDPTVPSWAKQSTKPSYTASEVGAVATSAVGAASGVVPLNASSKIDQTYLPSYVDDVIEGYYYNSKFYTTSAHTTEITGEAGKIYVDLATDKTYRWGGSAYAEISQGSIVSVSRDVTTGTKIATITINGTGSDLYAPTPPSAGTTASAVGTSSSGGSATTWSKSDHVHSISSSTITSALGYTPYNSTNPNGYTTNTGTITGVSVNGTSVATSGVANITSVPASILSGAIANGVTATTQSSGDNSTKVATTAYVDTAIPDISTKSNATNWLNGSATGSVRTAGSAAEDSNYTIGEYAVAEGYSTKASGNDSHAEGDSTVASGSCAHAEGQLTTASGAGAHAEGKSTTASGNLSHAEGANTTASDYYAHAEGQNTTASNYCAHAEGKNTTASGYGAHTEGFYTVGKHRAQHVFGMYNTLDPSSETVDNKGNYVEIVGNGTADNARSNARTLDWDGNEVLAGKLTLGAGPTANMDAVTKQYMEAQGYLTLSTLPIYDGTVTTP